MLRLHRRCMLHTVQYNQYLAEFALTLDDVQLSSAHCRLLIPMHSPADTIPPQAQGVPPSSCRMPRHPLPPTSGAGGAPLLHSFHCHATCCNTCRSHPPNGGSSASITVYAAALTQATVTTKLGSDMVRCSLRFEAAALVAAAYALPGPIKSRKQMA